VVQVLYNLLANAVGFSPHDAAVTISTGPSIA
jgi:signal transduction histidine kinase